MTKIEAGDIVKWNGQMGEVLQKNLGTTDAFVTFDDGKTDNLLPFTSMKLVAKKKDRKDHFI